MMRATWMVIGTIGWSACAAPQGPVAEAPAPLRPAVAAAAPRAPEPSPAAPPEPAGAAATCVDNAEPARQMEDRGTGANPGEPPPPIAVGATLPEPLACAALPRAGSLPEFIPAGWESISDVTGDLSGDGVADKALLICPSLAVQHTAWEREYDSCGACIGTEFDCAALVLRGRAEAFELWAVEARVRTGLERSVHLTVDKAILTVHVTQHGHYASNEAQLKYRAGGDELVLIGSERGYFNAPADQRFVSTNWLTHTQRSRTCSGGECGRWQSSRAPANTFRFGDGTLARPDEG